MNKRAWMIVALAAVGLSACGGSSVDTSAYAIGVPACDDFLAKYAACVHDKIPAEARATFEQSLKATRDGWKQALATPHGRNTLEAACSQVKQSTAVAVQAYGCSF